MAESSGGGESLDGIDRSDREVVRLARGSSFSLVCALVSQAALLVISIALTHFLSTADVGRYAQAHALVAIVALVALGGMRSALTRFVALYRADSDESAVHGTLRIGVGSSAVAAVVLGLLTYLSADVLAEHVFDDLEMIDPLRWAGLILPGNVIMVAAISGTQGYRNVRPFNVVRRLLEPAARLAATAAVLAFGGGLNAAMAVSALTIWIAAFVGVGWLRVIAGRAPAEVTYHPKPLLRFAMVSWGAAFAAQGLLWADILMIGWLLPSEEVAIYQVASRVALLAALSITPINSVLAPRLADLCRRERWHDVAAMYQLAAGWAMRLTLPGAIAIVVMPEPILSVFGPEYVAGVATILLLVPGQLFDASTVAAASVLNMAGENVSTLIGNSASLVINLGLNWLLIPRVGIEGAAIAWSASLVLVNAYRTFMVRRRVVDVWPWSILTATSLLAAVYASLAGFALHRLVFDDSSNPWVLVPVGLVIAIVYGTVTAIVGLTADDRLIVAKFRRTRRAAS